MGLPEATPAFCVLFERTIGVRWRVIVRMR